MKAVLLLSRIDQLSDTVFQQLVVWKVPGPVRGSTHFHKYRFALIADDICVLRYDNEAGKGDHKHVGRREFPYRFVDLATLESDFDADVERWLDEHCSR